MRRTFRSLAIGLLFAGALITTPAPAYAAPTSVADTSSTDFDGGVKGDTKSLSDDSDGRLTLSPGSADFDGTSLPNGWNFSGTGSASVSSGSLHLDGGTVKSPTGMTRGGSMLFRANFSQVVGQRVGFDLPGSYAGFFGLETYLTGGVIKLGLNTGTLPGAGLNSSHVWGTHTWKIDRTQNGMKIYILDSTFYSPTAVIFSASDPGLAAVKTSVADNTSDSTVFDIDYISTDWLENPSTDFSTEPAMKWIKSAGGNTTFAGGSVEIENTTYRSTGGFTTGHTLDIWTTFTEELQWFGWEGVQAGANLTAQKTSQGNMYLLVRATGGSQVNIFGPSWNEEHHYRIELQPEKVIFSIVDMPSISPVTINTVLLGTLGPALGDYWADNINRHGHLFVNEVQVSTVTYPSTSFDSLPSGWTNVALVTGGTVTQGSGTAIVNEARYGAPAEFASGRSLDFWANIGTSGQDIGWGQSLASGQRKAVVSVGTDGHLVANGDGTTTALGDSLLGTSHHYRIDWYSDRYVFNVLDVGSFTPVTIAASSSLVVQNMRPVISDNNTSGSSLVVASIEVLPTTGEFESHVLDAGEAAHWGVPIIDTETPANTSIFIEARTGNTSSPDGSWSSYQPVVKNTSIDVVSRFIQYKVTFSTTAEFDVPSLKSISFNLACAPERVPSIYTFTRDHAGDDHGLFNWLGSHCGESTWSNPATNGTVVTTLWPDTYTAGVSEYGPEHATDRDAHEVVTATSTEDSYIEWDLGAHAIFAVTSYDLLGRSDCDCHHPSSWELQGSNDHSSWNAIDSVDEEPLAQAQWSHFDSDDTTSAYRYLRLIQTGPNYIDGDFTAFGEIELYGSACLTS